MIFFLYIILTIIILYLYKFYISYLLIINPWLSFWDEYSIMQLVFFVLLFYMITNINAYLILIYLFLQLVGIGIFLAYYQLELFTAFLWVIEFTVILVCLLLLFYLNVSGPLNNKKYYNNYYTIYLAIYVIFYFLLSFFLPTFLNNESAYIQFNYFFYVWDNYYEALNYTGANDVATLTLSYYSFNSLELIIIGFILLVGSIVCIILNKNQRFTKNDKINTATDIFNTYNFLINSFFLRRQNLTSQNIQKSSLNVFKKIKMKKYVFINKE